MAESDEVTQKVLNYLGTVSQVKARAVAKAIKSATANAENNLQLEPSELRITDIFADEGRTFKRFRPQARGRANPILKRTTHISVFVTEEEGTSGT